MKTPDHIVEFKHRAKDGSFSLTFGVGEDLAAQLPDLALPTMSDDARAAFRALVAYETHTRSDLFKLIEARGFTAHACDYVPEFRWRFAGNNPEIYQPWADWLSNNRITRFHQGNTLTPENCREFSPNERGQAFSKVLRRDADAAFDLAKRIACVAPASIRSSLVSLLGYNATFEGIYPSRVPMVEHFLNDKAASVRKSAQWCLEQGDGWKSEAFYANFLAERMAVSDEAIRFDHPEPKGSGYMVPLACVSFDALAEALGVTAEELARRADLAGLAPNFLGMVTRTASVAARAIIAQKALRDDVSTNPRLFRGLDDEVWHQGLEQAIASTYLPGLISFLGSKLGSLSIDQIQRTESYRCFGPSITAEIESGQLPVNTAWDPMRILGLICDQAAADQLVTEAADLGIDQNNPRLTMLKLNLAL